MDTRYFHCGACRNSPAIYRTGMKKQRKAGCHDKFPLNKYAAGVCFHASSHPVRDELAPAPVLGNPRVAPYRACDAVCVAADVQVVRTLFESRGDVKGDITASRLLVAVHNADKIPLNPPFTKGEAG